ncbi:MAG: tRNA pseudouridine(55) synthase TruB [Coriobacteriales bacterium]|nr:tRNA pseudouridine(55) synthase TruB [Coriobacteriales bacterium]
MSGLNMLIAVDKPQGMTSHDVVNRARRALGERRVGHAGTLDPAATGVLLLGVGQGTRLMGHLTADQKSYIATIEFGTQTTTDDAEGEVVRQMPAGEELAREEYARELLTGLRGEQMQVPPAYSAISVDGRRAYARARAGEAVDLPARAITVYDADLLSIQVDDATVRWDCAFRVSKGTYVRALARDIGLEAQNAAHLCQLRRTASGPITLRDCISLDVLEELGGQDATQAALDPVRALGLPVRPLAAKELRRVKSGTPIMLGDMDACNGASVCMVAEDKLWGIWRRSGNRLSPHVNFPQGICGVRA